MLRRGNIVCSEASSLKVSRKLLPQVIGKETNIQAAQSTNEMIALNGFAQRGINILGVGHEGGGNIIGKAPTSRQHQPTRSEV